MRSLRSFVSRAASLALTVFVASCTEATDPEPIATITLLPALDSIELGETYSDWTVTLKNGAGQTLTGRTLNWRSLNEAVATVDARSGLVTAVSSGATTIVVSAGGKEATASLKVLLPILSIVATPDSFDLPLTTTRQVTVQLIGPNGTALTNRALAWSSENPGIAVVSTSGVVTAVSSGTTTISVTAGTKTATVRVRVIGEPVSTVRITPSQTVQILRVGQSKQLLAECLNASQQVLTGRTITWNSNNPVVASVNGSGLVTANVVGSANIQATCDNRVSAGITMQVTLVPVSSVTISPSSLTIADGTAGQLLATARDSAGNVLSLQGRQVVWTSNNIPVAQVSSQGVVSGNSVGTAEIQVSVDGVVSNPVTVTVTVPMMADVHSSGESRVESKAESARHPANANRY